MEKVVLKSTEDLADPAWVFVESRRFLFEDQEDIIKALSKCIVKWNLTDNDGKTLKITEQNVESLRVSDVMILFEKIRPNVETLSIDDEKRLMLCLSARKQGITIDERVPLDYVFYLYRQKFNISYEQLQKTPLEIIYKDLEFSRIEANFQDK